MAYEQKDGDFKLMRAGQKKSDKSPDMWGEALIDGKKYRMVAWRKQFGDKPSFLGGRIELDTRGEEPRPATPPTEDDDIPF